MRSSILYKLEKAYKSKNNIKNIRRTIRTGEECIVVVDGKDRRIHKRNQFEIKIREK